MPKLNAYQISDALFTSPSTRVYKGIRKSDQRAVILRTCGEQANASQFARLSTSAAILRSFDHPNIVRFIDLIDQSGQPWLIMENSGSINLQQYVDSLKHKQIPLEVFLNIAVQLADALSVIHHAQVIHKDLHPGNIVINPDTQNVQIIDFGLASLLSREQPALAPPENMEGALSYISPEQTGRMNRSLDYRSDFYTLGITFYQLLTGELPFSADDAIGLVHAHIARIQKPVNTLNANIPQAVSDIIDKLMHKTAEQRYQSAVGLKQDLEVCLRHIMAGNPIPPFTLGLHDISDRFQVPQVLYGREQEVKQLMDSFYKAAQGQPQLLAIEGFAGIGKSALIHEIHKPIAAHSGIFSCGKFDQFQKNTPYSALQQALSDWVQHALSLKESVLIDLREQLNSALGTSARVLIDFMDIFKVVLGDVAPLPKLGAQETQNRFHLVLQRFIQHITQDRPLVIFIDDLQWADRGTLSLLPKLMSADAENAGCRLLLLVAYRDNEVDASHPARQTLDQIKSAYPSASTITLQPLQEAQVNQLLVDALHQTASKTQALAELVEQKTGGNPFFVNEFLKTLYSEKLLNFDLKNQRWRWNLEDIKAQEITNNVVELMLGKMQLLPKETQHLLQQASCIGSLFDLQTLSIISDQSMPQTVKQLWPALKDGLLLQEGGDWLLGVIESQTEPRDASPQPVNLTTQVSPLVPHCRFLHDRMLQAAYQSLSHNERQLAHLSIGRLLYKHTETGQLENQLFPIVEQLNQGRSWIKTEPERLLLAQLNLQASEKAKQASAWEAAAIYAQIGVEQLPDTSWKSDYTLSYDLNLIHIESEFLITNTNQAKRLSETLLQHAKSSLEKAQICLLLATQLTITNTNYSIEKGLEGLRLCKVKIPEIEKIDDTLIEKEHQALKSQLAKKNWTNEITTQFNTTMPIETSLIYRLCSQLTGACQIAGNQNLHVYIVYKGMSTALEQGTNEQALVLYAMYSAMLAKQERYLEAEEVASTTLRLLEHYPKCADLPFIYMVLGSFVWFHTHPLKQAIELQLTAHEIGYEYGDILRGVVAGYSNSIINHYAQGLPLDQLDTRLKYLESLILKHRFSSVGGSSYRRLLDMLTQPGLKNQLTASAFTNEEWSRIQSSGVKLFIDHLQLQWHFWSDQPEAAWHSFKSAKSSPSQMSGYITSVEHNFISGLLICKQLYVASEDTQNELKHLLDQSLIKFKELSTLCPANFEHKYLLLQAERGRGLNQSIETLAPLYEAAIESAEKNEFLQYQALANELYGAFWLDKKLPKTAVSHIQEALHLYQHWGCRIKVNKLIERYEPMLIDEPAYYQLHNDMPVTLQGHSQSSTQNKSKILTKTSSQQGLDLSTIMKSTQAISSELAIKNLVAKVMHAILENSGAQHAALMLTSPEGVMVEANVNALSSEQHDSEFDLQSRPLNSVTNLPVSLINYVLRSNTDQVHQEDTSSIISSANTAFIEDPYLQSQQPKSVVCIPVTYREKVLGALYLENTLSYHAFPQERFEIIKMLLVQAAISFENARLFNEVSELNTGLEEKVHQRTQELQVANKELESFSYTVSHDLRAPLRTIKGFSEIMVEDYLPELSAEAQEIFQKVTDSADKMDDLITGLLDLARMQKQEIEHTKVSLSSMAEAIAQVMHEREPARKVKIEIESNMVVEGDKRMLYSVVENLLNNAWKYSSKVEHAEISFTSQPSNKGIRTNKDTMSSEPMSSETMGPEPTVYVIKDNGAGFDMRYAGKLFATFQRLHAEDDFKGTGVGLATVKRIIEKHGGEIWAEAEEGKGATFYFTLG